MRLSRCGSKVPAPVWCLVAFLAVAVWPIGAAAERVAPSGMRLQAPAPASADKKPASTPASFGGAEVLSDTQGVNFQPYLHDLLAAVYAQWVQRLPAEAKPPQKVAGDTTIRLRILPDGTLSSMHLDDSTRDDELNRAAWGAIAGQGRFPPLPAAFHGPQLELRIHFKVNE